MFSPLTTKRLSWCRRTVQTRSQITSMARPIVSNATGAIPPRPSASLIVVNTRNEILLVRRNAQASSFGGFHVFPGGNFDEDQDDTLAMTAIRETFEESGLLLASSVPPFLPILDEVILSEAREAIHARRTPFRSFLAEHHLKPDLPSLLPFTQWITPINAPRRYRTQFFVVFLLSTPSAGFSPDGGQEVTSTRFLHPKDAITEMREGKITFMPPQYYMLSTLSEILHGYENTYTQREQVRTLSHGLFGRMVINPRLMGGCDEHGRSVLTFEGDESHGGSRGRLHRALVRSVKQTSTEITVLRNFDIFTEIEECAFESVKL